MMIRHHRGLVFVVPESRIDSIGDHQDDLDKPKNNEDNCHNMHNKLFLSLQTCKMTAQDRRRSASWRNVRHDLRLQKSIYQVSLQVGTQGKSPGSVGGSASTAVCLGPS